MPGSEMASHMTLTHELLVQIQPGQPITGVWRNW